MKRCLPLLLCLALLLCGCAGKNETCERFSRTYFDAFDTAITLTCYTADEATFAETAAAFETELWRLNDIFDLYNPHESVTGLYALNAAGGAWLEVEPELYTLLSDCLSWRATGGERVNIALGNMLTLWHDYREAGEAVPPLEDLRRAAAHASLDAIELDAEGGRVRLTDPEVRLDLGAVAKGWSVERLAELLEARCPDYLIDAGGNIRAGKRAHDAKNVWSVGVTDPFDPSGLLLVLNVTDLSAVTSGGYQRYYEVDGVRYHHLIDPDTLMPANYVAQTTILTRDSGLADFLSTTTFLLPYEAGRALIDRLDGVEAIWVLNDGTVEMTEGAKPLIQER